MNSHDNNELVLFDGYENTACIKDDILSIQGDGCVYNVPIVDGMLSFINLDLDGIELGEDGIELPEHPFIELFWPRFLEETEAACEQCREYYSFLQTKFFTLITFCFDQGFYYEELGSMTAAQRLYVYAETHKGDVPQEITQAYLFDSTFLETFKETKKATPLEAAFGIPAGYVGHIRNSSAAMIVQYSLSSAFDVLSLGFYQMLERNIKIKKCKNCDRYFLVKTKRNSDYCDRLVNDTTQTCQQLAAVTKFAKKNEQNMPYKVFTKYYKRYHERKKAGTIKPAVFDRWNREACTMRGACMDGACTLAEFEQWCEDSFPNRKKKETP